ncbi:hypothetical protein HK099_005959 [Clydaea vesicula]|uniref:Protein PNS1 n=1 Tax=Clydaea vesicula TaxID=447962 RepID=A0AAD5U667_9FUNG|nr:hypothetical protein HK099_005959 [Clydaea vesicula]
MGKKEKNSREVNYDTKPIGTNKNRGCTDLPFLILFIVFWVGMYIIAGVAVETGDPKKLITPRDSRGQYCGVDNSKMPHQNENSNMDLTSKPAFTSKPLSVQICVEECPTSTRLVTVDDVYCNYDVPPITDEVDLLIYISDNRCNWFFYESKPILGRCVLSNFTIPEIPPKVSEALGLNLDELINSGGVLANSKETTMKVMTDIINAKWFIVGGTVVGFVICFVYLILMRLIGKLLIWVTLLATNALLVSCSVWLYFYWQEYRLWYEQLTPEVKTDADLYELYGITAGFFTCAAITAIILLISIFLRKRINIAIEVIKEAAKAIAAMPLIVFFPLWNFALTIGLFAYFCYVYVHIITPVENVSVTSFGYSWTDSKVSFYLEWYHIFGCLWGLAFLSGVNQVTFSGAIASYYWTLDKSKLPLAPIISAFYRTVRYHLGSICVGSLMLAIVQVIRLFLYSFQKQAG